MTAERLDLLWGLVQRSLGMPHREMRGRGFGESSIRPVKTASGWRVELRTGDAELRVRPGLEHAMVAQFVALTRPDTWRTDCRSSFCSEFQSQPG